MSLLRAKLSAMNAGGVRPPQQPRGQFSVRVEKAPAPVLARPDARVLRRLGADFDWPGAERLLFLDTETTGLKGGAGTLAFLVGLGYIEGDRFVTEQYLMGDYPDEAELLQTLGGRMGAFGALVTFNGRAFDLPLLAARRTMMRLPPFPDLPHLDPLAPSRRLWKKRLGSVRLSMLEEKVLRRARTDDLPGKEAPRRFFDYLKSGDRSLLEPVVRHNRLDVCSMAELLNELVRAYAAPDAWARGLSPDPTPPEDLLSLGRALERGGERGEAIACYRLASLPRPVTSVAALKGRRAEGEALFALGLLYKRMGDCARANAAFEALAQRGQLGARPLVELAKQAEHRMRDPGAALLWTDRALALSSDARERTALEKRRARLVRKGTD
ncbi:MAG: ribonuclease H-like domain-containing protein [Eubacteriales bacterium]|nr:ribonuclease H-like domain-containing protein [Eubacteriales bacterium]